MVVADDVGSFILFRLAWLLLQVNEVGVAVDVGSLIPFRMAWLCVRSLLFATPLVTPKNPLGKKWGRLFPFLQHERFRDCYGLVNVWESAWGSFPLSLEGVLSRRISEEFGKFLEGMSTNHQIDRRVPQHPK